MSRSEPVSTAVPANGNPHPAPDATALPAVNAAVPEPTASPASAAPSFTGC